MTGTKRLLALGLAFVVAIPAQNRAPLTIDLIMQGPQFFGYAPQDLRWSGDGQRIYFRWKQASDTQDKPLETWVLTKASGGARKLSEAEAKIAPPGGGGGARGRGGAGGARAGGGGGGGY